jgi:hypothetical protein
MDRRITQDTMDYMEEAKLLKQSTATAAANNLLKGNNSKRAYLFISPAASLPEVKTAVSPLLHHG